METILKSLNLRKDENNGNPKNLSDFRFLFEKTRTAGYIKQDEDTLTINKTSITIRKGILLRLNLNDKSSGALIIHNNKLCLITSPKKEHELFSITTAGTNKVSSKYIMIPKSSTDLMKTFRGSYKISEIERFGDLKISELVKINK